MFKLDAGFLPSTKFTHLHQIKAVGGPDDAMPLITLTASKSNPNRLELRHGPELSQRTIKQTSIAPLLGKWLTVKETITYKKTNSSYSIEIRALADSSILFSHNSSMLKMWKTDAEFLRPKWGIYRSLLDSNSLRDEEVLFSDFEITELKTITSVQGTVLDDKLFYYKKSSNSIELDPSLIMNFDSVELINLRGEVQISAHLKNSNIQIGTTIPGVYVIRFSRDKGLQKAAKIYIY